METDQKFCPICNSEVTPYSRYLKYVCNDCFDKATNKYGRKITFANTHITGYGCEGIYLDTREKYNSNICYIDGQKCFSNETRVGGIIIEKK